MGVLTLEGFVQKWLPSGASERANKDAFLLDLCTFLDVPAPDPKTDDPDRDVYVFEKDVRIQHEDRYATLFIDLYKKDCFILEAKQGSGQDSKKVGTAKRDTPSWYTAMHDARGQAIQYASTFDEPPPFILVTDLGYCFDLYANFRGSYSAFPNAQTNRIYLGTMGKEDVQTLRTIFTDPRSLDPSLRAAKVTREVAGYLATLAKSLEKTCDDPELIAKFLMRCIFTMFAEDIGMLPKECFTDALNKRWVPTPMLFQPGIEALWRTMNEGGSDFTLGKILKFNGGLFADPKALPMGQEQLRLLLMAALCDWSDVEPAIFGTLLERALDPKKRHALGAHFTPRSYVERLVKPTIEEPLRDDWDAIRVEVRQLVEKGDNKKARERVRDFHKKLCTTRVLDPACGSGNFLYVALDVFKRLETEVLALLAELGEGQTLLDMTGIRVTPAQFLGIEKSRWAKEIAELVLWIGYLQWHYRNEGKRGIPVPEPVLRDYGNIECRDAVLAYDAEEPALDENGLLVTRWDGETMKKSPVTGELIPDEKVQVAVLKYRNPRKADWPAAEFIVGNPPFLGKLHALNVLGESYVEALREAYSGEVPDGADLVAYWWAKAGKRAARGEIRRFGLVGTSAITQPFNRRVVARALQSASPIRLVFALPNHPWTDTSDGADVRIAMVAGEGGSGEGELVVVTRESPETDGVIEVEVSSTRGVIQADLRIGTNLALASPLQANGGISGTGLIPGSRGFILRASEVGLYRQDKPAAAMIFPFRNGRDVLGNARGSWVIDTTGQTEESLMSATPRIYQRLRDKVYPERQTNRDPRLRLNWWLFRRTNEQVRSSIAGLRRYVVTPETARRRIFLFLEGHVKPEHKLVVIGSDDAYVLGVLSSRAHVTWAVANGGRRGVGNDPVYSKTNCFEKFPFPPSSDSQQQRIRSVAERLVSHRNQRQEASTSTGLTLTNMYAVLEKLKKGRPLTEKQLAVHREGLVTVLHALHDDLDAAVFDTYGWPHDLTDEQILERLVALNAERAAEEAKGLVRWLRPEFQNPSGAVQPVQGKMDVDAQPTPAAKPTGRVWPKKLPEQIAAVRDLLSGATVGGWSLEQVAGAFTGAKPKAVEPVLQGLAALGILLTYEADGTRRWRATRLAGGLRDRPSVPPAPKPASDPPPAIDPRKLRDAMLQGLTEGVAEERKPKPKRFKPGEGVREPEEGDGEI
jgi:hypothetical protein